MVRKGRPKKAESYFLRIKLSFVALLVFVLLGFLGDYLHLENSGILYDFAKIAFGFIIGSGISVGLSR